MPPASCGEFLADPGRHFLSVPLRPPEHADVILCRAASPPILDGAGDSAWEDLAAIVLGDAERQRWRAMTTSRRRREWLLGRIAVKDAVRLRLGCAAGQFPHPAAIVVAVDTWGRPLARGPVTTAAGSSPAISIAHTDGVALGAASGGEAGLGVDVERLDRRRGDFESAAFHDHERCLLDAPAAPSDRSERALRLFCAKEAAAKALGRGFMGTPLNLTAEACDAEVTRVSLRPAGRLARALPDTVGPIPVRVFRDGAWIVGLARGGRPPETP